MVNIEYTGVNGKTTRFGSNSADEAMKRLRGIEGYKGNLMDSAAAGLAGAFAARHKNLARVTENAAKTRTTFGNVRSGSVFASGDGSVVKVPSVQGLEIRNGKLVAKEQSNFISEGGRTVSVGSQKNVVIGEVGEQRKAGKTINVITALRITNSGPLEFEIETTPVEILSVAGASSRQSVKVGEQIMVHESMSNDKHSLVYVISRKKNVPSKQAQIEN